MKRLIVLCSCVLIVALTLPVSAQEAISTSLKGVGDGAVVTGTLNLQGHASATTGVDRIELVINGVVVAKKEPSGVQQDVDISYTWDTTRSVTSNNLAKNGDYIVKVAAVSNDGGSDSDVARAIVNNAPSIPSGVTVSSDGSQVTVGWALNPEPDIESYRVERSSGNEFVVAGHTPKTSFTEKRPDGTYTYRVIAVRYSAVNSSGLVSGASATATTTVTAPAAGPGAGGGSGGGGGPGATTKAGGGRRFVSSGGKTFGIRGLPGGIYLPGRVGLPSFTSTDTSIPWGTYEEQLPYELPKTRNYQLANEGVAARSPWRIIPPDGLRWVAAGLLFVVIAALLQLISLLTREPNST